MELWLYSLKFPTSNIWKDGRLQIWGGMDTCDLQQLLWTSPIPDSTHWTKYTAVFTPNNDWQALTFFGVPVDTTTNGSCYLCMDSLGDIAVQGVNYLSLTNHDTLTTADSLCLYLSAHCGDSSAAFHWQSLPSGMSLNGDSISNVCLHHDTWVICTATYPCGMIVRDSFLVDFSWDTTTFTSVKELLHKEIKISISPNPATNKIFISSNENISSIIISDIFGRKIISTKEKEINIYNFLNGIYFISIQTKEGIVTKKFLKE